MSQLREHAARGIADAITARVTDFGKSVSVVQAPPSSVAEYPALAILIDKTEMDWSTDEEIIVDEDGEVVPGGVIFENGTFEEGGEIYVRPDGGTFSHAGTMRCTGRIWVGARLPGKREQIETKVWLTFMQDRGAPGRILIPLKGAMLGDALIMFGTAAALVEDATWNNELAFSERLWSWMSFTLDVPLIIPREDPLVHSLILMVTKDLETPVENPADLDNVRNIDEVIVSVDGDTTYTLAGD